MTPPYTDYFKLGTNHHLLFPAVIDDWDLHEQTLKRVAQMEVLDVVDLFLPLEAERQRREIDIIRASGKEVISTPPCWAWGLYWCQATPADGAENEDSGPMSQGV